MPGNDEAGFTRLSILWRGKLLPYDQLVDGQLADAQLFGAALPNREATDGKRSDREGTNGGSSDGQAYYGNAHERGGIPGLLEDFHKKILASTRARRIAPGPFATAPFPGSPDGARAAR
jgi:hypothetical protein